MWNDIYALCRIMSGNNVEKIKDMWNSDKIYKDLYVEIKLVCEYNLCVVIH